MEIASRGTEGYGRHPDRNRMFRQKRFLLHSSTFGIETSTGMTSSVPIPAGAILEVVSGPSPNDPRVTVLWEGRTLDVFVRDLQERGAEIGPRK
jgi:hypothetical protein